MTTSQNSTLGCCAPLRVLPSTTQTKLYDWCSNIYGQISHKFITFQIFILINKDSKLESIPNFFGGRLKNVILVRVDYAELVANTPLAETWSKGAITTIGFYLNNISDALRIIVLWRFGGTYLDSDIISVKPVPSEHQGNELLAVILLPFKHTLEQVTNSANCTFQQL